MMNDIDFKLEDVTNEDGDLVYPIVYWRGRLSVFARPGDGVFPHRFGGNLPSEAVIPQGVVLHALLWIDVAKCRALEGLPIPSLPLVYPFRHDGARLVCHWKEQRLTVDEVVPGKPQDDWPYEGYPDILPSVTMGSSAAFEVDREEMEELLCQGASEASDEEVIIVIPPSEDYGVSLWGEDGDAEMVQCVFVYDPKSGRIVAENQCS